MSPHCTGLAPLNPQHVLTQLHSCHLSVLLTGTMVLCVLRERADSGSPRCAARDGVRGHAAQQLHPRQVHAERHGARTDQRQGPGKGACRLSPSPSFLLSPPSLLHPSLSHAVRRCRRVLLRQAESFVASEFPKYGVQPSTRTYRSFVRMFAESKKEGHLDAAKRIVETMREQGITPCKDVSGRLTSAMLLRDCAFCLRVRLLRCGWVCSHASVWLRGVCSASTNRRTAG
jgi:hypothetical protein